MIFKTGFQGLQEFQVDTGILGSSGISGIPARISEISGRISGH